MLPAYYFFPVTPALTSLSTSQYYINLNNQYCLSLYQPSQFTLDSLFSASLSYWASNLHNIFKTVSCLWVCLLFSVVCQCVDVCKEAIVLNLNELNAMVTLTSVLIFKAWLSHTLPTLVYIQWMSIAMNANSMSSIFIMFQTQSNISLCLSLNLLPSLFIFLCRHCVHQSAKSSFLTFLTNFSFVLLLAFIILLHLHHFLCYSSSLHFSPSLMLSFKLLICFGGVKWIDHRWPNFSVDFPKLISCCIPVWIPNENCVKIGKSLICWNRKILFFPCLASSSLSVSLSLFCAICYGWVFIVSWSACASRDQISNMSHLSVLYFGVSRDSWHRLITNTKTNHCTSMRDKYKLWTHRKHTHKKHTQTQYKRWQTGLVFDYMWVTYTPTHLHRNILDVNKIISKWVLRSKFIHTTASVHRHTPPTHTESGNKFAKQQMNAPHGVLCIASLIGFLTHVCWINYFQRGVW